MCYQPALLPEKPTVQSSALIGGSHLCRIATCADLNGDLPVGGIDEPIVAKAPYLVGGKQRT